MTNILPDFELKIGAKLDIDGIFVNKKPKITKRILVVSDKNTQHIASEFTKTPMILQGKKDDIRLKPTKENAELIIAALDGYDSILAVGSGTINDLCKYSSFLAKKPYSVVPTAPSMNGYLSSNASIEVKGKKEGLTCHLPRNIYIDLEILKNSPTRLIKSGFGDAMARQTAQSDWFLAQTLKKTKKLPYNQLAFDVSAESEQYLIRHYKKLNAVDEDFVYNLMLNLLLSGIGMHISGGSHPASGGEHAICHYLCEKHSDRMDQFFHGEQVSCATMAMIWIQKQFKDYKNFHIPQNMQSMFDCVGLPYHYSHLKLKVDEWDDALRNAHKIRDRFGFLDLFNSDKKTT